jgi:DNA-binding NarL/FixJ family response regulator
MLTAISDTIRPMAATAPMPGLHGRSETSVLSHALDRAAAGRLAVVLAEGEAGIGKTRLLAETLTAAAAAEAQLAGTGPANLVAEGLSNPQIGERLYISRRTVQTHVAHIFMKLAVSSRAQLAAEVTRQPPRGWPARFTGRPAGGYSARGRLSRTTACGPGSA